ncbi:hypothetical protein DDW09_03785 [Sulfolobus sp. SCGC AB-777_L09]|nr:hypothetical protein DDW09_03785 [Sulfolobus sp. SCGC AB-777_L09]
MRNIILPILAVALVLLGILFYLHLLHPGGNTTTTTTTNTTFFNPALVEEPITSINITQTTTTQTTSQTQTTPVQTSTTKQQWYVQYAPEIVIAILLTLLGLLYKRRSKK